MKQAAVWYWRHFVLNVEVFASEDEAAEFAVLLSENGEGSIVGVQREDGSLDARDSWEAFGRGCERLYEIEEGEARAAAAAARPATREVLSPFDRGVAVVLADTPEWVGR